MLSEGTGGVYRGVCKKCMFSVWCCSVRMWKDLEDARVTAADFGENSAEAEVSSAAMEMFLAHASSR